MIDEIEANTDVPVRAAWEEHRYDPLPLDPFGAAPHLASRLPGLGGDMPAPDPSYVFATMVVQPALGPVVFTVLLADLVASAGTLVLRVTAKSTHVWSERQTIETRTLSLAELAGSGGVVRLEILSRKNTLYAVEGWLDDETDATTSGIGVWLDRREQADPDWQDPTASSANTSALSSLPRLRAQPELVTARAPTLTTPVSQPMTARQFDENIFTTLMATLKRSPEATAANWRDAYILQALRYYGAPLESARGFGITSAGGVLPAYLSGRGSMILAATITSEDMDNPSPALSVSAPDADGVYHAIVDVRAMPEEIDNLDFLWTVNIQQSKAGRDAFPQLLLVSMRRLKLNGLAVHVFPHEGMHAGQYRATPTGLAYTRAEIERMAISLVADGQEIAQLTFAADDQRRANREKPVPFGFIIRRRR